MRIAIVGAGQAGLVAAHAFRRDGHEVTVWSDRTPEAWRAEARPTGTAVRFATSLAYERELGLDDAHDVAPRMEGLRATICSHPGRELLRLCGRFPTSPLAIDLRLQSATWLRRLEERGGTVHVGRVDEDALDALAGRHDLTFVATGKEAARGFGGTRSAARPPPRCGTSRW